MLIPMTVLGFLAFFIGMFPQYIIGAILSATLMFVNIDFMTVFNGTTMILGEISWYFLIFFVLVALLMLTRFVVNKRSTTHTTWGCGYDRPNNFMQYTASSYADLFVSTLKPLFKRVSHIKKPKELFPKEAYYELEIEDIEEAYIVKPLVAWDEKILTKFERIQNGNIQQYILFGLIFLILAIIGMVYFGG